jgi:hypothetical protein
VFPGMKLCRGGEIRSLAGANFLCYSWYLSGRFVARVVLHCRGVAQPG